MNWRKFEDKLKTYLLEIFLPIDSEAISLKKNHTAAIIRLSVIVPTIYLLTFLTLMTYKKSAYNPAASSVILLIWILLFTVYIVINLAILKTKNLRLSRRLIQITIVLELCSNQLCLYATGSLTSHAVIFLPICICLYRIFFDYSLSLFCSVACSIIYITTVLLEFNKIIPLSPYLSSPIQHQVYFNPVMTSSFTSVVVIGIFITFFAANFSINQRLKLNRYIMDNWKNDLNSLQAFSQSVSVATDTGDIFTLAFKAIIQTNTFDMAALMEYNEKNQLAIKASVGWKHDWIENYSANALTLHHPSIKTIFEQKKLHIIDNKNMYPDLWKSLQGINANSVYIFPLVHDEKDYGLIIITNTEARTVSEHKLQLLSSILEHTNIAFLNLMNLSQEKKKASTDGLTGLYNRRYFDQAINNSVAEAIINNAQLSLIMIDADNFKKYNDTYGHPAGDQFLRILAETITRCVRSQDIAVRYGGEEFAVLLKNTGIEAALSIAERIRCSVENLPSEKLCTQVTISVGVGTLQHFCKDSQTLIDIADKSLYAAKSNGKNRVYSIFQIVN